jgi:hypothetical protein
LKQLGKKSFIVQTEHFLLGHNYYFEVTNRQSYALFDNDEYLVTGLLEAKPMVARTRSSAIGAQGGVRGAINTNSSVNLQTTFGFGSTREEHSAQFTRSIQTAKGYYDAVLGAFNPQTP